MKHGRNQMTRTVVTGMILLFAALGLQGCQNPASKATAKGERQEIVSKEAEASESSEEVPQIVVGESESMKQDYEHQVEFRLDDVIQSSGQEEEGDQRTQEK